MHWRAVRGVESLSKISHKTSQGVITPTTGSPEIVPNPTPSVSETAEDRKGFESGPCRTGSLLAVEVEW